MINISDYVKCNLKVTNKYFLSRYYNEYDLMNKAINRYGEFHDTLIVKKNEEKKYGFVDNYGNIIVPFVYDNAWNFNEGLALVSKDNKYGFIDSMGKLVVPCIYDYANDFSDGLAYVEVDDKKYFIDKTGQIVFESKYIDAQDFSEGLARVEKNNKYGFIDKTGKLVIPCIYDYAKSFSCGLAAVDKTKWGKNGYINKQGKIVLKVKSSCVASFHEDLASICDKSKKEGYINKKGKIIVPCIYDYANDFSDGLAIVKKESLYGVIDKQGRELIPCEYESLEMLDENLFMTDRYGVISFLNTENNYLPITTTNTFYVNNERELEKIINNNTVEKLEKEYCSAIEIDDKLIFIMADSIEELNNKKIQILETINTYIDEYTNEKIIKMKQELLKDNKSKKDKLNEFIDDLLDSEYQKVLKK